MPHPTQSQLPISQELANLLAPRILARVNIAPNGCWIRYVNVNPGNGYTWITYQKAGRRMYPSAHRIMYVSAHGEIPHGMTVDHLCENRACCNPDHLRLATQGDNAMRATNNSCGINARKTHCLRGHLLPPYVRGQKRKCAECVRVARKARRAAA